MANHKLATVAAVRGKQRLTHPLKSPAIRLDENHWSSGRAWVYVGDETALLRAGLVRREWLPGTPDCPQSTTFSIIVGERKVSIEKRNKREFAVGVAMTDEEWAAARQRRKVEKAIPGLGRATIPPDVATRLLACWGAARASRC
jgi:hypothetical protein